MHGIAMRIDLSTVTRHEKSVQIDRISLLSLASKVEERWYSSVYDLSPVVPFHRVLVLVPLLCCG
jgi:hypothetical protein